MSKSQNSWETFKVLNPIYSIHNCLSVCWRRRRYCLSIVFLYIFFSLHHYLFILCFFTITMTYPTIKIDIATELWRHLSVVLLLEYILIECLYEENGKWENVNT